MNKVIVLSACIIILHVVLTIPIIHSTDLMYINKIMPRTGYPINITGDAIIAGNVGINTTNPEYELQVGNSGDGTSAISNNWNVFSSRRWKTNITPIENALDKVMKLKGVYFDWKSSGKHDIGMIAEEVGEVIPEVVDYDENGIDANSLDYSRLVAVLIEAIKEQQKEIEELKIKVNELQKV